MSDDECEDTTGFVMRCHYEVLTVSRKCTEPEIRRAYKMAALRCHPDKNYGRLEEADEEFKEVQNSYSVLIDPDERAWYDAHRISILRGGDGSSAPDEINLFNFMSPKAYTGFGDNAEGFFGVYAKVFNTIIKEESDYSDSISKDAPRFGKSDMAYKDGVGAFYIYWKNFSSFKNFAWKEEFKVSDMPDRWHRREAEKANAKERNSARKEYTAMVQQLAIFLYNRDPRVAKEKERIQEENDAKEEEKARKADEQAKRGLAVKKKLWAEIAEKEAQEEAERAARGDQMDGSTLEALYEKQRQMEALRKKGGAMRSSAGGPAGEFAHLDMLPDGPEDASGAAAGGDVIDFYKCMACKKTFKTAKMWAEHVKSGKHKTKIKALEKQGVDVSKMLITPGSGGGGGGGGDDDGEDEDDEDEETEEASSKAPTSSTVAAASSSTKTDKKTTKQAAKSDSEEEEDTTVSTMAPKKGKGKKGKKLLATPTTSGAAVGGKCDTLDPDFLLKLAQDAAIAADESSKKKKDKKKGGKGGGATTAAASPAPPATDSTKKKKEPEIMTKKDKKKADKKAMKGVVVQSDSESFDYGDE